MAKAGELKYKVVEGWEQLPKGFVHKDVVGVGVDANDRVYILTRYDPRVIVYEKDGTFVASWAEGMFKGRTHGIRIGPDGSVWCVDDGDHCVRKFSPTGELLMTLGTPGVPSDTGYDGTLPDLYSKLASIKRGGPPFNKPTNISIAPDGELYVTDGYANARVHRFTADGQLIQSWGEPGTAPGQFNLPHDVWVMEDGRVFVADRENDRIQIFTRDGKYLDMWTGIQRPTGIYVRDGLIYISENCYHKNQRTFSRPTPFEEDQPGRVAIFDMDGKLLHRWGNLNRCEPGQFAAPHCICVDSEGSIYVGEVVWTEWVSKGLAPEDCHSFQKFVRV